MAKKRTRKKGGQTITAAVESVLNEGILGPQDVSREVKTRFNLDVKPSHISTIKNQWKKKAMSLANAQGSPAIPTQVNGAVLAATIEFVKKVGGLKAAQDALNLIRAAKEL